MAPDKSPTTILAERALNTSNSSAGSGLYSSNPTEVKEKQNNSAKILDDIKKYLDKTQLPQLLGVFKEVKECEKMEPVFKKLKHVFFGNTMAPSRATDRYYREKVQCLEDLGSMIPRKKQEEYKRLVSDLKQQ